MSNNGTSPRIGLLLAHRIIREEIRRQGVLRDRAKKKNHADAQDEAEYAVSILQRVLEDVSTEAKKHNGRATNK